MSVKTFRGLQRFSPRDSLFAKEGTFLRALKSLDVESKLVKSENSLRSFTTIPSVSCTERTRTATSSHRRSVRKSLNIQHADLHFLVGDTAFDARSSIFCSGKAKQKIEKNCVTFLVQLFAL